jgi:hypothetical protein
MSIHPTTLYPYKPVAEVTRPGILQPEVQEGLQVREELDREDTAHSEPGMVLAAAERSNFADTDLSVQEQGAVELVGVLVEPEAAHYLLEAFSANERSQMVKFGPTLYGWDWLPEALRGPQRWS